MNGIDFAVKIDVVEDEVRKERKIGRLQELLEVIVRYFIVGEVQVL